MFLTRRQAHVRINKFNKLNTNQQVNINDPVVNYVLRKFEGNIYPRNPQGIKIYPQATK